VFVAIASLGTTCNSEQLAGATQKPLLSALLCDLCGEKRSLVSRKISASQYKSTR
jgi:hypothetical protein